MRKLFTLVASDAASFFLLALLVTVIALGSFLPQNAPPGIYAAAWGSIPAGLIVALGLDDAYHSWLFLLLAAAFTLNLFHRTSKGFLSLPALLTILGAGALAFGVLYGAAMGVEGVLPLSVGESRDVIVTRAGGSRLPFSVRLDGFTVVRRSAAVDNFRSTLRLCDGDKVIGSGCAELNHPLRSNGYSFYQQSYDPQRPDWTGLKVVRDPGVKFVFLGLLLVNAGIVGCIVRQAKKERAGRSA